MYHVLHVLKPHGRPPEEPLLVLLEGLDEGGAEAGAALAHAVDRHGWG